MTRSNPDFVPSYRKHQSTGQAVVTLNGQNHYLGSYGTAASKAGLTMSFKLLNLASKVQ